MDIGTHACKLSPGQAESGESSQVRGHPGPHKEHWDNLGYRSILSVEKM